MTLWLLYISEQTLASSNKVAQIKGFISDSNFYNLESNKFCLRMYIVSGAKLCCFSGFWQRTCFTDLLHCPLFKNESIHSYVTFVTSALSSIYALPFSTVSPSLMLEQLWTTYLLKLRTTTCASWDIKSCKQLSVELYNSRRVTKAHLSILVFFSNTLWHMTL